MVRLKYYSDVLHYIIEVLCLIYIYIYILLWALHCLELYKYISSLSQYKCNIYKHNILTLQNLRIFIYKILTFAFV